MRNVKRPPPQDRAQPKGRPSRPSAALLQDGSSTLNISSWRLARMHSKATLTLGNGLFVLVRMKSRGWVSFPLSSRRCNCAKKIIFQVDTINQCICYFPHLTVTPNSCFVSPWALPGAMVVYLWPSGNTRSRTSSGATERGNCSTAGNAMNSRWKTAFWDKVNSIFKRGSLLIRALPQIMFWQVLC